jgi:hypothetical protein
MFNLKRPCVSCPFRRGQGSLFRLRRLGEIRRADAFQCHRTVDYSGEVADPGSRPQQCVGLLAVLWREAGERGLNTIGQVAMRLGALDPATLDPEGEAYASWAEVLRAHVNGEEPDEHHQARRDRRPDHRERGVEKAPAQVLEAQVLEERTGDGARDHAGAQPQSPRG